MFNVRPDMVVKGKGVAEHGGIVPDANLYCIGKSIVVGIASSGGSVADAEHHIVGIIEKWVEQTNKRRLRYWKRSIVILIGCRYRKGIIFNEF